MFAVTPLKVAPKCLERQLRCTIRILGGTDRERVAA